MAEIEYTLSKSQTDMLFDQEAVLFGTRNGVPEYRIVELFGDWAATWLEKNMYADGYLNPGSEWNGWGDCGPERPMRHHFYRSGFHKIASEHNYRLSLEKHNTSTAGSLVDSVWKARCDRLAAAEAEKERKRKSRTTTRTGKKQTFAD